MEETWRNIKDFELQYQVSNLGNVKSNYFDKFHKGKQIKPFNNGNGYLKVNLHKDKVINQHYIHSLVAKAFPEICGEWFDGCVVDHVNTIRTDNRAENLRVCTQKENTKNPLTQIKLKDTKFIAKSINQYNSDGVLIKTWNSIKECEEYGFDHSAISKCCRGKYKTHKGYIWKYER